MKAADLLKGNVIGIIDAYGAVHSKFTAEEVACHEESWPGQVHARWRWNHRESIHWFLAEHRPNEEEIDAMQRHLSRKYGLKWWENGHHDIDDLIRRTGTSER